jgi:holliday junction DNA helicase RuvA
MIHHLNGRMVEKTPTYAVIECGGVGYQVHISLTTFEP